MVAGDNEGLGWGIGIAEGEGAKGWAAGWAGVAVGGWPQL